MPQAPRKSVETRLWATAIPRREQALLGSDRMRRSAGLRAPAMNALPFRQIAPAPVLLENGGMRTCGRNASLANQTAKATADEGACEPARVFPWSMNPSAEPVSRRVFDIAVSRPPGCVPFRPDCVRKGPSFHRRTDVRGEHPAGSIPDQNRLETRFEKMVTPNRA